MASGRYRSRFCIEKQAPAITVASSIIAPERRNPY